MRRNVESIPLELRRGRGLHPTLPYSALLCPTLPYSALLRCSTAALLCATLLYSVLLCPTLPYSAALLLPYCGIRMIVVENKPHRNAN